MKKVLLTSALVGALQGCLVPETFRMRDSGVAPATETTAQDTNNERIEDSSSDVLDGTLVDLPTPMETSLLDAPQEAESSLDVATDTVDAMDASDVTDAIANDTVDAAVVDSADVQAPEAGPDTMLSCGPAVPFVTLDDLRAGLPMNWTSQRYETGADVTMTSDGAAQLPRGTWIRSGTCGTSTGSFRTRVGGTWDLRAMRSSNLTDVRVAVRTGLSAMDPAGVECIYNLESRELTVRRRSGGTASRSASSFPSVPAWIHMDVWDDGTTVRCTATNQQGRHLEASLTELEAPTGYVAFYTTGAVDRSAVLDDLIHERGLLPALHEYNFSEEMVTDPAIDRVGTEHGMRGTTAAIATTALLGRGGSFNGSGGNATIYRSQVMPSNNAPFTVSFWVLRDFPDMNNEVELFGNRAVELGGDYFGIRIQGYLTMGQQPGAIQTNLFHNTSMNTLTVKGRRPIAPNTWNHVAVVRSDMRLSIYVNGQLDQEGTTTRTIPLTSTNNFGFGRQFQPAMMLSHRGMLDELRIYDVALSPEQIAALGVAPLP